MKQSIIAIALALSAFAAGAQEQKPADTQQPTTPPPTLKAAEPLTSNPGSTPAPQYINSKPKSVIEGGDAAATPGPQLSPFVAAARRSNRAGKKVIVITNEMLAKEGGHFTSTDGGTLDSAATAAAGAPVTKPDEHTSPDAQKVLDAERKRISKQPADAAPAAEAPKQQDGAKH